MKWTALPPEIWTHILALLPISDIKNARKTCKLVNDAAKVDLVWLVKCKSVLNEAQLSSISGFSFFDIYSRALHKYGYLLGCWRPKIGHYGGFIHIGYDNDCISAYKYDCPSSSKLLDALTKSPLFTIALDSNLKVQIACNGGYAEDHTCDIEMLNNGTGFEFKCSAPEMHNHPAGVKAEYDAWLSDLMDVDDDDEDINILYQFLEVHTPLSQQKFAKLKETQCHFTADKFSLPGHTPGAIIQPGLFKGTYSAHGVELLNLTYEDNMARLTKITGDPNVPAGEESMCADLHRPMVLSLAQQSSIQTLLEIDIPDLPPDTPHKTLPTQPFTVPLNCYDRESNIEIPTVCKARFHSEGQVAGSDFLNPSHIKSHWIIFDEDTFGHLWLGLKCLSIFCRVKDKFL